MREAQLRQWSAPLTLWTHPENWEGIRYTQNIQVGGNFHVICMQQAGYPIRDIDVINNTLINSVKIGEREAYSHGDLLRQVLLARDGEYITTLKPVLRHSLTLMTIRRLTPQYRADLPT